MIDRSLMVLMLTVLCEQRELSCGTEEGAFFNECNLRALSPVTTPLLREHVALAEQRGWLTKRRGTLEDVRLRLTPAGAGALEDLKRGG